MVDVRNANCDMGSGKVHGSTGKFTDKMNSVRISPYTGNPPTVWMRFWLIEMCIESTKVSNDF